MVRVSRRADDRPLASIQPPAQGSVAQARRFERAQSSSDHAPEGLHQQGVNSSVRGSAAAAPVNTRATWNTRDQAPSYLRVGRLRRHELMLAAEGRHAARLAPRSNIHQRAHARPSLPSQQFQVLFHSLFRVLFTFPSQYLFAIGLLLAFSLPRNLPRTLELHSQATRLLGQPLTRRASRHEPGFHRLWLQSQLRFAWRVSLGVLTYRLQWRLHALTLWAVPASLAATEGITVVVFSSA